MIAVPLLLGSSLSILLAVCVYRVITYRRVRELIRLFFFNDTATTEIYTRSLVGSVRCV